VPLGVVRDQPGVTPDVLAELVEVTAELPHLGRRVIEQVERVVEILDPLQRSGHVPVPEEPANALQRRDDRGCHGVERPLQPARHLLEHGEAHGDVEVVEDVLGVRPHVELEIPDALAAVGQEGDFLVHRDPLGDQQLMQPAPSAASWPPLLRRSDHPSADG
jgi:hypothetical protein